MPLVNGVNVERLLEAVEQAKKEPSKTKRTSLVTGKWILDGAGSKFVAEVKYEKGSVVLEADQPSFMGGGGTKLGPMHYCLYGLASCFAATLATVAAQEGIELKRLEVAAEGHYDYSKTFGISDRPVVEEILFKVKVDSSVDNAKFDELLRLAEKRCPAVNCLTNPVKTSIQATA